MTEYTKVYLQFKNSSLNFSFYFYYCEKTTFEDLLEYIIINFEDKKICKCFKLETDTFRTIDLTTNFKEYYNKNNSSTFLISNLKGRCNCDSITKNYTKKSRFEIIGLVYQKINKINSLETEKNSLVQKNIKLEDDKNVNIGKITSLEEYNCKLRNEINVLKLKVENINIQLNEKDKKIKSLENDIQNLKKKIDKLENIQKYNKPSLEEDNSKLKNEINELKLKDENINIQLNEKDKEIKSLKNNIQNLNQKNNNLENEKKENIQKITSLEKVNKELNNKLNEYENKQKEYEETINKLNKNKQLLEIAVNGDITKINQLKNLGVTGEYLKPKEHLIKVDSETNKITSKAKLNKDIIFIDFYDVIIDINSIKDINKGWEIKMSERAKENYQSLKKEKIIKIGVIGNSNKGKSFILSKLSKIELPSGTSIRTEGLSVKYPDLDIYTNRKIVLLDSAGLETPVLKKEDDKKVKIEENAEIKTKGDNEDLKEENIDVNKNEKELFKEKSREKLITELFLQNYIIYNTNILIIVVGILTYSEQKLINRIQTEIQRTKINKKLFIIHNLITYTTIEQIKEYIDTYLLKSATFNLEEGHKINTLTKEENGIYFFEKNTEPKIYHLIFANEGSEAGEFYNNFTLNFIENQYADVTDLKTFDVIETVKDKFIEISKEILEKIEAPFQKTDFDDSEKNYIKLKNIKNIKLKKCLIDELGFSNLKTNSFEPNYNCYKKEDKIIIRVEVPGNCNIKTNTEHSGEYTLIRIEGTKKKDKEPEKAEDNLYNSRELGPFSFNIPLKTDEYLIKNEKPKIEEKKGLIIIQFQLDEKLTETDFEDISNNDV